MHREGKVRFASRCQDARRAKACVIDVKRIGLAFPFDRIGWVRNDGIERFIVPMSGLLERIAQRDIELIEVHIVQEHVDACKVVSGQVDLLAKIAVAHVFLA